MEEIIEDLAKAKGEGDVVFRESNVAGILSNRRFTRKKGHARRAGQGRASRKSTSITGRKRSVILGGVKTVLESHVL